MVHTHTRPATAGQMKWQWKWDDNENEMKDYRPRTRRGERKRRGKEHTPTWHTWPRAGKPRKGKERKNEGRRKQKTSGGGGRRKRLNQHAQDPTYLQRGKHMRKGLVKERMHPQCHAESPHQAHWPKCHVNPIDGLHGQPELSAQLNLTKDQKSKNTTPKVMSWSLSFIMLQMATKTDQSLEQHRRWRCRRGFQLFRKRSISEKRWELGTPASC